MTTTQRGPSLTDPAVADPGGWSAWLGPPVLGTTLDGSPAWYVTRAQDVRFVLSDARLRTSPVGDRSVRDAVLAQLGVSEEVARPLTDSILDAGGVEHTRLRKLVSRAFTVRRVTDVLPHVQRIVDGLLYGLGTRAELVEELAYPLPIAVICELVGVPAADQAVWLRWGESVMTMTDLSATFTEMTESVHALIAARRRDPAGDLVTALVQARDEGDRLSDAEMSSLIATLLIGGHETTTHLITNSVLAVLGHPEQLARLRRDPTGWPAAVHELMRLFSPVHVIRVRYAVEDVEVGGVTIPAGAVVQPVLAAANRDAADRPDPERFDVARQAGRRGEGHVGFGYGIHRCLGAALAREEAAVTLSSLFGRFPELRLDGDPVRTARPGMARVARLPVRTH